MNICSKIVGLTIVMTLSTHCMKRPLPPVVSKDEREAKINNKKVPSVNFSSREKREIVFDHFMLAQGFDQRLSQEERARLEHNFVRLGIVEGDNKVALLLQQYFNIIMTEARTPQKKFGANNEIFFE